MLTKQEILDTLKKQKIEYTDFPLDQIVLYCCPQEDLFVIMLPSEW